MYVIQMEQRRSETHMHTLHTIIFYIAIIEYCHTNILAHEMRIF